jgi:hypothetical protein
MVAQKPHGISTGHGDAFRRPSGTPALPEFEPGNELPGYFRVSLRDKCAEKALSDPAAARGVVGAASCDLSGTKSPGQQVVRAARNVARRRCIECGSGTPAGVRASWGSFRVVSMVRRWGVGDGGTHIGAFDRDEGASHLLFRPFRAGGFFYRIPRALPWAILCRPFRAGGYFYRLPRVLPWAILCRPFRAGGFFYRLPRALPWAILCRPFRAEGRIEAGSPVVAGLPHPAN